MLDEQERLSTAGENHSDDNDISGIILSLNFPIEAY